MHTYSVYGWTLHSELEFPDLPDARGLSADWTIRIERRDPPSRVLRLQGVHEVEPGWTMQLYEGEFGRRLSYGGAGTFDVEFRDPAADNQITWYPKDDLPDWFIRAVILNTVLGLALHDSGILCLHASAVAIEERCVAFMAPKFHGKSTLAMALVARGAQLVTDDLVAVELNAIPPMVRPGVPSLRLLHDSALRLGPEVPCVTRPGPKVLIGGLPSDLIASNPLPLETIYVLEPVKEQSFDVRRERLDLPQAAAQVALRTTLRDTLIGLEVASTKLRWVSRLVSGVEVCRLQTARDYDRLGSVADRLLGWHARGRSWVPA